MDSVHRFLDLPVGTDVGNVRNDGPQLIEEVEPAAGTGPVGDGTLPFGDPP